MPQILPRESPGGNAGATSPRTQTPPVLRVHDRAAAESIDPADRAAAVVIWRHIHGLEVPAATDEALPPHWADLALTAREGMPPPGDSTPPAQWKGKQIGMNLAARRGREGPELADVMAAALAATEAGPWELPHDPRAPKPFSLGIVGAVAFLEAEYPREFLVDDVAVIDEPMICGGERKALKTTTMLDFAASVAVACPFLGTFSVPRPRRVLFLSGESGAATTQETLRRICLAKDLDPLDLNGQLFLGFRLPKLSNPDQLKVLADYIRGPVGDAVDSKGIDVVIIDPLYLCLLSGGAGKDAGNLFDMGPLLQTITDTCREAGATPILVHHLRKNRAERFAVPELDDLAFAGVQEFARQWLLIGRREAYEPGTGEHRMWVTSGGSAGHSMVKALDVTEGVADREFRGRTWTVSVKSHGDARVVKEAESITAKAERLAELERVRIVADDRKREDLARTALDDLKKKGPSTLNQWRTRLGWPGAKIGPVKELLLDRNQIHETTIKDAPYGVGKRDQPGYAFGPNPIPDESRTNPGISGNGPGSVREGFNPGLGGGLLPEGEAPIRPRLESPTEGTPTEGIEFGAQGTHKRPGLAGPTGGAA